MSFSGLLALPIFLLLVFAAIMICLGCVFIAWVAIEVFIKDRRFSDLT